MSVLPLPPIHKGKKFVVLSDWVSFVCLLVHQADVQDGTITDKDSNDYMTDNIGQQLLRPMTDFADADGQVWDTRLGKLMSSRKGKS